MCHCGVPQYLSHSANPLSTHIDAPSSSVVCKSDNNCSLSGDSETCAPHASDSFYSYEELQSKCNVADGDGSLVRWFSDNSLNRHRPAGDSASPNAAPDVGRGAVALEPRDLLKRKLKTYVSMVNLTTSTVGHQHRETVAVDVVVQDVPSAEHRLYRQCEDTVQAEGRLPAGCHRRKAFGGSSEAIMYLSQNEMDQSLNRIFGEPKYGDIRRRTNSYGNDSYYARRRKRSYRPNSLNVFAYAVRTI